MKKKRIIISIVTFIITFLLCLFLINNVKAENQWTDIRVSANSFKSYMNYKLLKKKNSPQYRLQQFSITVSDGFRKYANRYVIAVGTGVGGQVGDCVDLILENGQVICCVIGDYKNNRHTDPANLVGKNGCCAEFIVDTSLLRKDIKLRGNVGTAYAGWDSPVLVIRRYNINSLGGM